MKILEALSYISSIILVPLAFYGLKQIGIARDTTIKESKRDSLRVTSVQIECFFKDILPENDKQRVSKLEKNILESITLDDEFDIDYDKSFEKLNDENRELTKENKEKYLNEISELFSKRLLVFNRLEAFSSNFTSGLGDENTAYTALGKTYTGILEKYINIIRYFNRAGYYKNIVIIYDLWRQRLIKEDVSRESKKLRTKADEAIKELDSIEKKINKIEDRSIKSIGVDK